LVECTACGFRNPAGARFCARCGTSLAAEPADPSTTTFPAPHRLSPLGRPLTAADAAAVAALPPGSAMLVVLGSPEPGSRFLLDRDVVTAGRHPDSDIFLDDVTVSRRHAVFRRDSNTWTVADEGSLNGTYLNRDRVDLAELTNGAIVQIGKFRLVFYAGRARD
jgi:hypothetical protein